ncbi:MAG: aminomethyl-transferring glycine dehydrogenase [Bdellovibrionales bacterium]|nr:aminomethyl-transferring glycine dehydrogenase [Bdellovibrionales bacterium]
MFTFAQRHIGPNDRDISQMLATVGAQSLDDLTQQTIPSNIAYTKALDLPQGLSESEVLAVAQKLADRNQIFRSYIGQGYYGTFTPPVILRNILENPGWYTAYTPYQPEISQGRLEALINFQTMVTDLTGLEISNASLLDEGTAAAEAMAMAFSLGRQKKNKFFVQKNTFPQTLEVLKTRATPIGIELVIGDWDQCPWTEVFGVYCQYPAADGTLEDLGPWASKAKQEKAFVIVGSDLLALTLYKSPGEMGADIVVGSTQRFGVPMGFGGPHAAFIATRGEYARSMPGRIVGVSKDSRGNQCYRLTLQTREQHIRREKATSNICTAQVLLAVIAGMYATYYGPHGLKSIAQRVRQMAFSLREHVSKLGYTVQAKDIFDTVSFSVTDAQMADIKKFSQEKHLNFFYPNSKTVQISLDETVTDDDLATILSVLNRGMKLTPNLGKSPSTKLDRTSAYLEHPVFNRYHSETEMLRYIFRLQKKDLTLADAMIPLGSCTMKLNATTEMIPVTWKGFANLHPFAPIEQVQGTLEMIRELDHQIQQITGFKAVSLQPNAGSQGEYAGLLVIREYHKSRGDHQRNICLIPSSAHGTNPASAAMVGMSVVVVRCDDNGNVDIEDLKAKASQHAQNLACLMITYPSTHGVFEEDFKKICEIVHAHGGQVYMDGANMNALVGVCRPGDVGADVSHLNLHKTFCIPHGGGGPGVGPIGVGAHLAPFLPQHSLQPEAGPKTGVTAVSAAPWGSALILPISWSYIKMMGAEGLKKATQVAILNANYIAKKLEGHFPVLYTGKNGRVAHECIIDVRQFKSAGVSVDDIAKRLMDFGFHAPTMSFPVAGTLMIEPTESESRMEMDRFCEAMIQIRREISAVESGKLDKDNNPLRNAPHTAEDMISDWDRPYTRAQAFFPLPWVKEKKFWVSANRVDNVYGDKNIMCSCPPISDYETPETTRELQL